MMNKFLLRILGLVFATSFLVSTTQARTVAPGTQTQEGSTSSEANKSGKNSTDDNNKKSTTNPSGTKK